MKKPGHTIKINPLKVAISLLVVSVVIIIFSLIGRHESNISLSNPIESFFLAMFNDEFYVNNLTNVAVYWNMLLLTIISALAFAIASVKLAQKDKYRYEWWLAGALFFYFAVDELAGISQKFSRLLKDLPNMNVGTYYNWFYPVAAVAIVLILAFLIRFYFHLDAPNKFLFPISIILYILGAFGEQLLSGHYAELYGKKNTAYLLITHAEKFGEQVGIILMIYLLLTYIVAHYSEIEFTAPEPEKTV